MGEHVGELPRGHLSFHCLENESNELKNSNTEGTENFPDLPRASEAETVIVTDTETSLTKSLIVLHVAAVGECFFILAFKVEKMKDVSVQKEVEKKN